MDRFGPVAGLLVAALIALAIGVAFPPTIPSASDDTAPSSEATEDADEPVNVIGGYLDVDITGLWAQTQASMDREVNVTPRVVIEDFGDGEGDDVRAELRFHALLLSDGRWNATGQSSQIASAAADEVYVNEDWLEEIEGRSDATRRKEEVVVHEFAHVIQYDSPAFDEGAIRAGSETTDQTVANYATIEGGVEFVADDLHNASILDRERSRWMAPSTSAEGRYGYWEYYHGLRYVDDRLEDPGDLWELYENPPETTATILRGDPPGEGPPDRDVVVTVDGHHVGHFDRPGAILAETALTRELDPARAREIAAGWRWGALRSIQPDGDRDEDRTFRHVWITEWRDEAAADEFEDGMTAYLDATWESEAGVWNVTDRKSMALERVDEESLAVVVAPEPFLESVAVTRDGSRYDVINASSLTEPVVQGNSSESVVDALRPSPTARAAGAGA